MKDIGFKFLLIVGLQTVIKFPIFKCQSVEITLLDFLIWKKDLACNKRNNILTPYQSIFEIIEPYVKLNMTYVYCNYKHV